MTLTDAFFKQLRNHVLIRETGKLTTDTTVKFLGRTLKHTRDSVLMYLEKEYVETVLEDYGMTNCKPAVAPGTVATTRLTLDSDEALNPVEHKLYRRAVGTLLWPSTVRSDILYAVKELSRGLSQPCISCR